jgi:hypothetical protein
VWAPHRASNTRKKRLLGPPVGLWWCRPLYKNLQQSKTPRPDFCRLTIQVPVFSVPDTEFEGGGDGTPKRPRYHPAAAPRTRGQKHPLGNFWGLEACYGAKMDPRTQGGCFRPETAAAPCFKFSGAPTTPVPPYRGRQSVHTKALLSHPRGSEGTQGHYNGPKSAGDRGHFSKHPDRGLLGAWLCGCRPSDGPGTTRKWAQHGSAKAPP